MDVAESIPEEFPEQAYLAHRQGLVELGTDQIKSYDRILSGLSGGALALSIVFLRDVVGDGRPSAGEWIFAAWGAFIFALVANLISYKTSWLDTREEVARLDECFQECKPYVTRRNRYRTITVVLNAVALLFFVIGTTALATFAFLNLD